MQDNIALAIKTALEENKDKLVQNFNKTDTDSKRPDLFSLTTTQNYFKMNQESPLKLIDQEIRI